MFIFPRAYSCYSDTETKSVTSYCGHQQTIINRYCWRPLNTHPHTHTGTGFLFDYFMICSVNIEFVRDCIQSWDVPRRCCHGWQFVVFIRTAGCVGPDPAAAATWQLSSALLHNAWRGSDFLHWKKKLNFVYSRHVSGFMHWKSTALNLS